VVAHALNGLGVIGRKLTFILNDEQIADAFHIATACGDAPCMINDSHNLKCMSGQNEIDTENASRMRNIRDHCANAWPFTSNDVSMRARAFSPNGNKKGWK
jgi:hypothetical protein